MTISSSVRVAGPYTGTGSVSIYPFSFKVFQASDVLVKQTDLSGDVTTLALTTNYSVTLSSDQNANPGGSIDLNTPLPNGYQLVISSQVQELQGTSLTNNGGFYPNVIENALDYLTILVQQAQTEINASLQVPLGGSVYDAGAKRVVNLADGQNPTDASTVEQMQAYANNAVAGVVGGYGFFQAAGAGAVSRTFQDKMRDTVSVKDFGVVVGDPTKGTQNFAAIQAALKAATVLAFSTNIYDTGGVVIDLPPGNIYISGNGALSLTYTQLQALGMTRYPGIVWKGTGRMGTKLILQNTAQTSDQWFYDNRDASAPNPSSSLKFAFEDIAFCSATYYGLSVPRLNQVPDAQSINGFYFDAAGAESQGTWVRCDFLGLDTCFSMQGTANGDTHLLDHCNVTDCIKAVVSANNSQSVGNQIVGGSYQFRGDMFNIGQQAGGEFHVLNAHLLQYPRVDGSNNLVTTDPVGSYGLVNYVQTGATSGPGPAPSNANFVFEKCRVECYENSYSAVVATNTANVNYGSAIATFRDCTFVNNYVATGTPQSQTSTTNTTANSRKLVYVNSQTCDVVFDHCTLDYTLGFQYVNLNPAIARTRLSHCYLYNYSLGQQLIDYVSATGAGTSAPLLNFVNEGSYQDERNDPAGQMAATDFEIHQTNRDGQRRTFKGSLKSPPLPLAFSGSAAHLYLPAGVLVTQVELAQPGVATPSGPTNVFVKIEDSASNVIWTSPTYQQDAAYAVTQEISPPFKVPAAPNNYLVAVGANGTIAAEQYSAMFEVKYVYV